LLRQHGYNVSEDFLTKFKASHGGFMECLQTDIKGLLKRYLHEAKLFATEHLLKLKGQENIAPKQVYHALELPLFRRIIRGQARGYIDAYAEQKDANLLLLKLAKLDFNMVQSAHKKELQEVSMWDIDAVKHMPEHLHLAFTALYNTVNQMGSKASLPILVKVIELCKSMVELRADVELKEILMVAIAKFVVRSWAL
nr:(E)-beta-ocimene synthase, chloroplastic-like [Tanacetum cinerariifolium]